jgi:pimeloyl-ACP methyl ester carboxylesterase
VWQRLSDIDCPTLILGGSSDVMHNPQNVELMVKKMKDVQYIDLKINSRTHGQEAINIMRTFIDLGVTKV